MPERPDLMNDVPPVEYEQVVDELSEELTVDEQRVLAESKRVVPVWGLWGLGITGVLLIVTLVTQSVSNRGVSIGHVRAKASEYSGQTLKLRGRVADVFAMTGSHVYYLVQGRDTMVVFTRGTPPSVGAVITVEGTLSVGYLDGSARPALFATSGQ